LYATDKNMAESIHVSTFLSKEQKYQSLLPQLQALVQGEDDFIANLANICAALKSGLQFFWVGFYFVKKNQQKEALVLGPFQGTVACTRISKGKGVCGTCWEKKEIQLVPDVSQFEGHIACSSESKSEIVLPAFDAQGEVFLVLDVDSDKLNDFDDTDRTYLEMLMRLLEKLPR